MMDLIDWDDGMQETIEEQLLTFARSGLRTLVMGRRELSDTELEQLNDEIEQIESQGGADKKD